MSDLERQFELLDGLRKSGIVNMFGAAPFLQIEFPNLTIVECRTILRSWMETFDQNIPAQERATKALEAS